MKDNRPKWSAGEIVPAYKIEKKSMGAVVNSTHHAFDYIRPIYGDVLNHKEVMCAIYMSSNNKIIGHSMISSGGVSACVCDPKIVFQDALMCNATAFILVHNHPSGNLKPSSSDDSMTRKIKLGGELLDIKMLDHIIIAEGDYGCVYFSYADEGKL